MGKKGKGKGKKGKGKGKGKGSNVFGAGRPPPQPILNMPKATAGPSRPKSAPSA